MDAELEYVEKLVSLRKYTKMDWLFQEFQSIYKSRPYNSFLEEKDSCTNVANILSTLEALHINTEKFWYMASFIEVASGIIHTLEYTNYTNDMLKVYEMINAIEAYQQKTKLVLEINKRGVANIVINSPESLIEIAQWFLGAVTDYGSKNLFKIYSEDRKKTFRIWIFAKMFNLFFIIFLGSKDKRLSAKSLSGQIDLSRNLLIARLAYYFGLSENESYLKDKDCLNGIYKQYKAYNDIKVIYGLEENGI